MEIARKNAQIINLPQAQFSTKQDVQNPAVPPKTANTGQIRGKNDPKTTDAANTSKLSAMAQKVKAQQEKLAAQTEQGKDLIIEILNADAVVEQLLPIIDADTQNSAERYAEGLEKMVEFYQPLAVVNITELAAKSAATSDDLSHRFQQDKIKPVLEQFGFLTKNENRQYQWASLQQITEKSGLYLPEKVQPSIKSVLVPLKKCVAPLSQCKQWAHHRKIEKAQQSIWCEVDKKTGQIKVIAPELKNSTKQLMRELEQAKTESELRQEIIILKDGKLQQQIATSHRNALEQTAMLEEQAMQRIAVINANSAIRAANIKSYLPIAVPFLALVALVVIFQSNQSSVDPQAPLNMEAAGFNYQPQPTDWNALQAQEGNH